MLVLQKCVNPKKQQSKGSYSENFLNSENSGSNLKKKRNEKQRF